MTDEQQADLSQFFTVEPFGRAEIDSFGDRTHESLRARERFEELLGDYRRRVESGDGDALRLGVGLYLLGRFEEAIESLRKARKSGERFYYTARCLMALQRREEALEALSAAAGAGWDAVECDLLAATLHVHAGDEAKARKLLDKHARAGEERADWHYLRGLLAEYADDHDAALEAYKQALALDGRCAAAAFRAARLHDIRGEDEEAVALYRALAARPRTHVNALINLAVIYEDQGEFDQAAHCLQRVLAVEPEHARARLFLKDVQSSKEMVVDDTRAQQTESRDRLLQTPINEFELSVRARNCLKKMQIVTLGDLLKLTEAELLAYKNFGETSLNEIKALLAKKGLHLGQRPEDIDPETLAAAERPQRVSVPPESASALSKPVAELELSVRARRCLQRLNISTVGDLIQCSEAELLAARNFGQTSLNEIKTRLAELGLSLAPKQ
ncbi:MAG: tetratricopeptide repeat protein [Planctomycetota bacterium]|nr:MAG: tetratricopeptide repeat protein [Planctomycetota bacterium]